MTNAIHTHEHVPESVVADRRNYKRLLQASFILFVVVALLSRLFPRSDRTEKEGIVEQARRNADTVLPFLFIR